MLESLEDSKTRNEKKGADSGPHIKIEENNNGDGDPLAATSKIDREAEKHVGSRNLLPDIGGGTNKASIAKSFGVEEEKMIAGNGQLLSSEPSAPDQLKDEPAVIKQEFNQKFDESPDRKSPASNQRNETDELAPKDDELYVANEDDDYFEEEHEKNARQRSYTNAVYRFFYLLVTSVSFNFFIFMLIIGNTLTLAAYTYD